MKRKIFFDIRFLCVCCCFDLAKKQRHIKRFAANWKSIRFYFITFSIWLKVLCAFLPLCFILRFGTSTTLHLSSNRIGCCCFGWKFFFSSNEHCRISMDCLFTFTVFSVLYSKWRFLPAHVTWCCCCVWYASSCVAHYSTSPSRLDIGLQTANQTECTILSKGGDINDNGITTTGTAVTATKIHSSNANLSYLTYRTTYNVHTINVRC